ncbi:MAG TPA: 3-oxoacyl-[acyl-carrier-protein] synthase III C-terminal domain-containing protein, partial [Chitinophagaceae bacterium]
TLRSAGREINRLLESRICHDGNTVNNLKQRGNTASTAHFIALADHIRNNKIQSGDKIVFSISASGLTIGTALYEFDDLPDRYREMEEQQTKTQKVNGVKSLHPGINTPRIRIESVGTIPSETPAMRNSLDLLQIAANGCQKSSGYEFSDIGLLIYCGIYRTEYLLEPAYATLLAGQLDMNATVSAPDDQKTLAFDIFNGAVGFLNSCYVAQQMIAAGNCSTAMVVAAEAENNTNLFPDEAVGVRETASAIILDVKPGSNTGFSRFVFRHHTESLNAYITNYEPRDIQPQLHVTKAADLELLYISYIYPAVQELLELEGLDINKIDVFFPPQISSGFINLLSKKFGLPLEKFVDVVGNGPDLFSSSIPYAFEFAVKNKLVKPGDVGLMIAAGSGLQVGCAIYYF